MCKSSYKQPHQIKQISSFKLTVSALLLLSSDKYGIIYHVYFFLRQQIIYIYIYVYRIIVLSHDQLYFLVFCQSFSLLSLGSSGGWLLGTRNGRSKACISQVRTFIKLSFLIIFLQVKQTYMLIIIY